MLKSKVETLLEVEGKQNQLLREVRKYITEVIIIVITITAVDSQLMDTLDS